MGTDLDKDSGKIKIATSGKFTDEQRAALVRLERDGKNVVISVARHAGKTGHDPAFQRQVDAKKKILAGATVLLDLAGENERLVVFSLILYFWQCHHPRETAI